MLLLDPVRRSVFLSAWFFFLVAVSAVAQTSGDIVKVRAEGWAAGVDLDAQAAAVQQAYREAVSLALGAIVNDPEHAALRPILDDPERYVQTSRVLSQEKGGGGVRVDAEVYVQNRLLRLDTASLLHLEIHGAPRVLLVIGEELAGEKSFAVGKTAVGETTLKQALEENRFTVVSGESLTSHYTQGELLAIVRGDERVAARFGRENQTDVVVVGSIRSEPSSKERGAPVGSIRAEVVLKLVRSADARVFASVTSEAEVSSGRAQDGAAMAIRDAVYKVQQELMVGTVLGVAGGPQTDSRLVRLTIVGPRARDSLAHVQRLLGGLMQAGQTDIYRANRDHVLIEFEYSGTIRGLVDALRSPAPSGMYLESERVVGTELVFRPVYPSL